jgi:hypothetical protein
MKKVQPPVCFSPEDINVLGRLINNISFVGSQLLAITRPELYQHARANLKTIQRDFGEFIKRLDALGTQTNDIRVARLLEDIEETPLDAAGILTLVNQCFQAVAFLSHCLVVGASVLSQEPLAVHPAGWRSDPSLKWHNPGSYIIDKAANEAVTAAHPHEGRNRCDRGSPTLQYCRWRMT